MELEKNSTELTREALFTQVRAEPMSKVARRYRLSDRGLAKVCQRMGIPVPGRGYWARLQAGRVSRSPKLPTIKPGQQRTVILDRGDQVRAKTAELQKIEEVIAAEGRPGAEIVVSDELLVDLHLLVARTAKSLRGAKADERGIVRPKAKRCLDVRVGKESIDRAARILDALVTALSARGIELSHDDEDESGCRLVVDGESVAFFLEEKVGCEAYQQTPAEQKQLKKHPFHRYSLPRNKHFPSKDLTLKLAIGWWGRGLRSSWSDGKRQRIETCLNKFIVAAYQAAAAKKAERLERERRERKWEEQARRREILQRQIEQEQQRLDALTVQAKAWQEAQQLREYIRAVRSAGYYPQATILGGRDLDTWCAWAQAQADRLDPTVSSPPSVLDYRDQFFPRRRIP